MSQPPKIDNAPGLKWKARAKGRWEARWRPRGDLVSRGYPKTMHRVWLGTEPTEKDREWISDRCNFMQNEMLIWGQGGIQSVATFDKTLRGLIGCYQIDKDSPIHKIRINSRRGYARILKRMAEKHGDVHLADIKVRTLLGWHQEWMEGGKVAMAHGFIGTLRTIINFGATYYEDPDCERISGVLHRQKFKMAKPREERLTADQANAIRTEAHKRGWHSVALAQAFQFEGMLRQKDVIGEWVPYEEPGTTEVHYHSMKWLRGIRWSEIDGNYILRHITSKREKEITIDLKLAPMVMDELRRLPVIPATGPVVVNARTGRPFTDTSFRYHWRALARAVGIPNAVFNMDSRAGAITEATDAGAPLEHVRQAATHSDISMTQRYSRGGTEQTASVMKLRTAHRDKPKT